MVALLHTAVLAVTTAEKQYIVTDKIMYLHSITQEIDNFRFYS